MIIFQLGKSWEIDIYNENDPLAFHNWRLRQLSIIEDLVEQSSARLTLFKPILNTPQTPDLLTRFPEAKVLFAFRNYRDVINSSIKRFGVMNRVGHVNAWIQDDFAEFAGCPPPEITKNAIRNFWSPELNPEDGAALYWLFYNRLFFDLDLHQDGRVRLVSYETLVSQPEKEFRKICQHLGLAFTPRMVAGIFSSSIDRDLAPCLDTRLKAECEELWLRLCDANNASDELRGSVQDKEQFNQRLHP